MTKNKDIAKLYKRGTTLWWIGWWATVWWAVSLLYIVLLFWVAKDLYIYQAVSGNHIAIWASSLADTFSGSDFMQALFAVVILVWVVLGLWWLRSLNKLKLSYRAALKDLFGTIR